MNHERGLQKALIAQLKGDAALTALIAGRVFDGTPADAVCPHLSLGRWESRPVGADGGGVEHIVTLTATSRFDGTEEAKAILAAVRARTADAALEADGVRTVSLGVRFTDVFRTADRRRTYAVMRLRAVTEEI